MNKIISKINSAKDIEGVFAIAMLFIAIILLSIIPLVTLANTDVVVEALPDNKVFNDFVVGPGKIEMELAPGEKGTFDLMISNRLGTVKTFSISEEDFTGSNNPDETVVLLGNDRGPYSLRDYVRLGASSVDIEHGTRVRVPISVTVPKNAEPGGLYGSVLVGIISKNDTTNSATGVVSSNPIVTRIGTLVFVRVKGEVKEDGKLVGFKLAGDRKIVGNKDDLRFNILFQNEGNVHLNPKGIITIKNLIGTTVGTIDVESWFAMPKSLRFREVQWKPSFIFGKYTAYASIERGYGDMKDEASISFWFIPWKIILLVFVILIVIVGLIKKLFKKKSVGSIDRQE